MIGGQMKSKDTNNLFNAQKKTLSELRRASPQMVVVKEFVHSIAVFSPAEANQNDERAKGMETGSQVSPSGQSGRPTSYRRET
jgi:hypothetical protein